MARVFRELEGPDPAGLSPDDVTLVIAVLRVDN
jgi:hypothetical protein